MTPLAKLPLPIYTERLIIQTFNESNIALLWLLYTQPSTFAHDERTIDRGEMEKVARFWRQQSESASCRVYGLELLRKEDRRFLGTMGMKLSADLSDAVVSYRLARENWGKAYCTEGLSHLSRYAFACLPDLQTIRAFVASSNEASIRVLERTGFRCSGSDGKLLTLRGDTVDKLSFVLSRPQPEQ